MTLILKSGPLKLTRLSIGLFIEDTQLYNQWHRQLLMGSSQEHSPRSPPYPILLASPQSWRDWICCQ